MDAPRRRSSLLSVLSPDVFFPNYLDSSTSVSVLVYVSQSVESFEYEEFQDLVQHSHESNQKKQIAGYLLHSYGHLLQLIEGPSKALASLWKKIKSDPRHTNVSLVSYEHATPKNTARKPGMVGLDIGQLDGRSELVEIVSKMLSTISSSIILLQTFIQPPILDFLVAGVNPTEVKPQATKGMIVFFNIRDMDKLTSTFPIQETVALFNSYYETCLLMIHSKRGRVMKFIGESVLAYWPDKNDIDLAISSIKDILMHTAATRRSSPPESILSHLVIGIGASFGSVTEGNVGTHDKLDYTLVGDAVNVAARLAKKAVTDSKYRLLFDKSIFNLTHANVIRVGSISVKGKHKPLTIYSLRDKIVEYGTESVPVPISALPEADLPVVTSQRNPESILKNEGEPTNLGGESESMIRLTYISERTVEMDEDELQALAAQASNKNKEFNITGLLIVVDRFFIQTLEGARSHVLRIYDAIQKDSRHKEVTTVLTTCITQRKYSDWNMRGEYLTGHSGDIILSSFAFFLSSISNSYSLLRKYSQPAVSNALRKGTLELALVPKMVDGITWVCDVVSFTTICEKLPSSEIVSLMNAFFQIAINLVENNGGRVTKLIGDCVVAAFPPEAASSALTMSIELAQRIAQLRTESDLYSLIYIGMGISYGRLFEGPIGSSSSKDFAMIGASQAEAFDAESATRNTRHNLVVTTEYKNLVADSEYVFKSCNPSFYEVVHDALKWDLSAIRQQQAEVMGSLTILEVSSPSSSKRNLVLVVGGSVIILSLAGYLAYRLNKSKE